jgi:putative ABC transport system substrate-binding protein
MMRRGRINRRRFIAAAAGAVAAPGAAGAQQPVRLRSIGYLSPSSLSAQSRLGYLQAFREGLRQRGYVEGRNIAIHDRWAELRYERLAELAAELVGLKVDVIVTHGTPGAHAAQSATATIPIVVIVAGDLVAGGLVASLARPGGNLTGQHIFTAEIAAKRLELLKDAIPGATRFATLVNPANSGVEPVLAEMLQTARALRLELLPIEVRAASEFPAAFARMAERAVHGLVQIEEPIFSANLAVIAELAAKHRIPAVGPPEAKPGTLIAYGVDLRDLFFRSASFIDRLLKGARPADLPIERATKFELAVNLKAAKALGITVPPSLLVRADEVIE